VSLEPEASIAGYPADKLAVSSSTGGKLRLVPGTLRALFAVSLAMSACAVAGCTRTADIEAARSFDRYPLYWVGERFEKWDLEHVDLAAGGFSTFIYGTCEIEVGTDGGCPPPLQIQIQPLCAHLETVARAPIWKQREVRGAPVGTIDSAPVLFTNRVQVKVYRGQGSDPGLPMRALRALRSANDVEPTIGSDDLILPAPRSVLSGTAPCSA
jgi:hypothetical protein